MDHEAWVKTAKSFDMWLKNHIPGDIDRYVAYEMVQTGTLADLGEVGVNLTVTIVTYARLLNEEHLVLI